MAVIRGDTLDRPPVFDMLRNDAAIEFYADESFNTENVERIVYKAIANALDATKQVIRVPGKSLWDYPDGRKVTWERWTHWVEPLPFDTVDEVATYLRSILDDPESFMGDAVSFVADKEKDYLDKQAKLGDFALFMDIRTREGFHDFYELLGLEKLALLSVYNPDLLGEFLDLNVRRALRRIQHIAIADQVPLLFYAVDIAGKQGTIFSPASLRKVLFPRLEEVLDAYHQKGIRVIFHSDGNLWKVMDDLVALGIDAFHPVEVNAGMNLTDLRTRYPDLLLLGGIDATNLLPFGSPDEVAEEVRKAIAAAGPNYMVASTTELHNQVPLENIRAMIDTARDWQY
jgi:hypothetical protein